MSTRRGRTPAFGRTARLIVGALAVAAVVTTSALAGTIVGTAQERHDPRDGRRGQALRAAGERLPVRDGGRRLPERRAPARTGSPAGRSRHGRRREGRERRPGLRGRAPNRWDDADTTADDAGTADTSTARSAPAAACASARQGRVLRRLREHRRQRQLRRRGRRAEPVAKFGVRLRGRCQPPGRLSARDRPTAAPSQIGADRTFSVDGTTSIGHHREVQRHVRRRPVPRSPGRFQIHVPFD